MMAGTSAPAIHHLPHVCPRSRVVKERSANEERGCHSIHAEYVAEYQRAVLAGEAVPEQNQIVHNTMAADEARLRQEIGDEQADCFATLPLSAEPPPLQPSRLKRHRHICGNEAAAVLPPTWSTTAAQGASRKGGKEERGKAKGNGKARSLTIVTGVIANHCRI